jgi:HEAT repeat protein
MWGPAQTPAPLTRSPRRRLPAAVLRVAAAAVLLSWPSRASAYPTPSLGKEMIPSDAPREVRELVEQLYSDNDGKCAWAARQLGEMGPSAVSAAPFLASVLHAHWDCPTPNAAAQALIKIGKGALDSIAVAASATGEESRRRAMAVLARLDGERATSVILDALTQRLDGGYEWACLRLAGKSARERILRALESPDAALRKAGVLALPALSSVRKFSAHHYENLLSGAFSVNWNETQRAVDLSLRALGDADTEVRLAALNSLSVMASCGDKKLPLAGTLLAALKDQEAPVRLAAIGVALRTDDTDQARFDAVQPLLSDADLNVSAEAITALCGIPGERARAVPLLLGMLKDAPPAGREKAALALGDLRATEATDPLLQALKSPLRPVQAASVKALGQIGGKAAVEALIEMAMRESDPLLRTEAVRSLSVIYQGYCGKAPARHALKGAPPFKPEDAEPAEAIYQALSRVLTDPSSHLHEAAIEGLVRTPQGANKDLIPLLAQAIKSPDGPTRVFVVRSFLPGSGIRDDRLLDAVHELILKLDTEAGEIEFSSHLMARWDDPRSIPVLMKVLARGPAKFGAGIDCLVRAGGAPLDAVLKTLGHPSERLRGDVATVLSRHMADPKVSASVRSALTSDDPRLRDGAERVVARGGPREARLFVPPEHSLRTAILGGWDARRAHLDRLQPSEVAQAATDLLRDPSSLVRAAAIMALAESQDASAIPTFVKALADESAQVRSEACLALGRSGDRKATPALIAALNDAEDGVRESAAAALGRLGDPAAAEPLVMTLACRDAGVRRAAARSLGRLGGAPAGKALRDVLARDPDWRVRRAAAAALSRAGKKPDAPALIAALGDEHWSVRLAAHETLAAITRQKFGPDQDAWRAWWQREGSSGVSAEKRD